MVFDYRSPSSFHSSSACGLPCKFASLFSTTSRMPLPQPLSFHAFASLPGGGHPSRFFLSFATRLRRASRGPSPLAAAVCPFCPSLSPLFSCSSTLPILQLLCFDNDANCRGGWGYPPPSSQIEPAPQGEERRGPDERTRNFFILLGQGAELRDCTPIVSSPYFAVRASYNPTKERYCVSERNHILRSGIARRRVRSPRAGIFDFHPGRYS